MGKKLAKGKEGNVLKYISRPQALKKLQINLSQFRRICILKGIYPVEPSNKRKLLKGSTALKTFYYRKDISYLLHEPILQTFRQEQIHDRKLGKALGKKEFAVAKQLMDDKPVYTLDHIIKERYPTFIDAIRDLDDCLSMISLFATLPSDEKINGVHVKECQRLLAEFQNYIIQSGSLKKAFLSIKGIYYQAEIRGQSVTWIAPYQFSQAIPHDVDFRVMSSFLEVHETLLAFINYKLYADLNLIYPPKLNQESFESGAGLQAYILESRAIATALSLEESALPKVSREQKKEFKNKLKTLDAKLKEIEQDEEMDTEIVMRDEDEDEMDTDEEEDVPEPVVEPTTNEEKVVKMGKDVHGKRLFSNCVFWISREVPHYSLEFVIKSAGGRCGWDESVGSGSPYLINDSRITHHLSDRPESSTSSARIEGREYLQPQWVYDCLNAGNLVKTSNYHPGEKLPSHLSPFVVAGEDDYSPDQEIEEYKVEQEEVSMEQEHYNEIQAEAAGIPISEYNALKSSDTKDTSTTASKPKTVLSAVDKEAKEAKELSKIMMSKRDKKLYDKIQFGKARKQEAANKLIEKRKKNMKSSS